MKFIINLALELQLEQAIKGVFDKGPLESIAKP